MAKFKLVPNPTFNATVAIHRAGEQAGDITFTFNHYPVSKLDELEKVSKDKPLKDFILDIATGWDLEDEFNKENLDILLDNYPKAGDAILRTFYAELFGSREKN